MNAKEFVQKLGKLYNKETVSRMKKDGLPDGFINEYKESFFFKSNNKNGNTSFTSDPLIDLVENYDGSKVHIGMITFDLSPFEDDDYYFFGKFEADLLGVNKNLKTVQMIEYGTANHVLYTCASNSDNFLKAILLSASILEKSDGDPVFSENDDLICKMAEECGEIAGSKADYQDFYKMLLGCDI